MYLKQQFIVYSKIGDDRPPHVTTKRSHIVDSLSSEV